VTDLTTSKTPQDDGPDLIKSILREARGPLTTRELQNEVRKVKSFCPSASVVGLNVLRIAGAIRGKRSEEKKGWIWWIEN
jgi:hypothetical protein